MARYEWIVEYGNLLPRTELSSVQEISIQKGRTKIQDPFKSSTAVIRGRNFAGLPNIELNTAIYIYAKRGNNTWQIFSGKVADFKKIYGQVAEMDTWEIYCEDILATLGRAFIKSGTTWAAGTTTMNAALGVATAIGTISFLQQGTSTSLVSAQDVSNLNGFTVVNQLAATEQGYIYPYAHDGYEFASRNYYSNLSYLGDFTDGTLTATYSTAKFTDVQFGSFADSYFTSVVVEPNGLAAQTSGVAGERVYTMNSYDQTTAQAQNLADYVLATLNVQQAQPSVISAISEIQTNDVAMICAELAGQGRRIGIILRSQRYEVFVEGATITATPEQSRFSFNVVSSKALNFFILDSHNFGVLNQNRLGF